MISGVPWHEILLLIGDFNAQLAGSQINMSGLGTHGLSFQTSDNGLLLFSFNQTNHLTVGYTLFNHRDIHKKTWHSPNGSAWNKINYICINNHWKSSLDNVQVYCRADVGSNHYLLIGKVHLRLKGMPLKKGIKPFAREKLEDRATADAYHLALSKRLSMLDADASIAARRESFKSVIKGSAEETIDRMRGPKSCKEDIR